MNTVILIFSGAFAYAVMEIIFEKPMLTYVFGHELTHALASLAMGGKVHSFKVSKKGGSVSLSKTNFFVALAPYCLPIYTIFTLLIYWVFRKFSPFPYLDTIFLVTIGFTLTFHGSLTFHAIRQRQPDLKKTGNFFSLVFITLTNCWLLAGLSKIIFLEQFPVQKFCLECERAVKGQSETYSN